MPFISRNYSNPFSWLEPHQNKLLGVALGKKSPCVERCPKMKVQRERGCKTASVQVSNLTIAGSNLQEEHVHGTGGRRGVGGKELFMLKQPFLRGAIRPTTFFGTNQAEEEKLEGEAG